MTDIWTQHDAAFRNVSAYVVLKDGKVVAKVAMKHGNACTAFVHWIGIAPAKGQARGYGYDKASAAVEAACKAAKPQMDDAAQDPKVATDTNARALGDFRFAILAGDDGQHWDRRLRDAGFDVVGVV